MDGLSAAASAFGVVSLAVQLIQLTQNLRDFFNDVSGAPIEIRRLTLSLTQLASILRDVQVVTEMQQAQEGAPSAPLSLLDSLKACEEKLLLLKTIVDSSEQMLRTSGRVSRHWESFKVVFKKKDMEKFGKHLQQSIQFLTTAMTMNLMVLHLAGLEMTTSIARTPRHPALTATALTETLLSYPLDRSERTSTTISRRITTSRSVDHFQLPFNSQVFSTTYTRKTKIRQSGQKIESRDGLHAKEYVLCISSKLLGYYISLCFKNAYGSISHSLQVDPIAGSDAPIFSLCAEGDITGVQDMFARRIVSPYVRDPTGRTLLHYAANGLNTNLITLLLDHGLDANKTEHTFNQNPLQAFADELGMSNECVNIIRTLIVQGQSDPMDLDGSGCCLLHDYYGNSDGYLFILNQEEFPIDVKQTGDVPFHVIAEGFARSFRLGDVSPQKSWEPVLRRALQLGLSLIPKVPGTKTTLDSLFGFTDISQDDALLAQEWLSLLTSVGVDVDDYIREEKRIHSSRFLRPKYESAPKRRLIFEETSNPKRQSIRWKWFYHPEDPASDVLTEFSAFGDIPTWVIQPWQDTWPFFGSETIKGRVYKSWSEEERSEVKSKKAILEARWATQAARRQRRSEYSPRFKKPSRSERRLRVPGAWVEDHLTISFKWPRIRILRFPWWLYLFTLGVAFLCLARILVSRGSF